MVRRSVFSRRADTTEVTPPEADRPGARRGDWPAQAADLIVEQVGWLRARTAGPAIRVARLVVFAVFAALLGSVALILLVIGAIRLLDVYLPEAVFGSDNTWAAYCILGGILIVAGIVTSRRMTRSSRP